MGQQPYLLIDKVLLINYLLFISITVFFKGLENPMMSCSLSPYVDDAKVADVVIPHVLRRPHVQGPQYMHKFLLVDRSSKL